MRTAALYASFLVAAPSSRASGAAQLGAHQIAFQLCIFLALVLDAIAIAGQVIVGRTLGAGDADGAHAAAVRMIGCSVVVGRASRRLLLSARRSRARSRRPARAPQAALSGRSSR